nr:corticotropin-releasing factor-like diuretic hormone [Carausius morosus]
MVLSALVPTLVLLAACGPATSAPAYFEAPSLEALGELDAESALLAAGKQNLQAQPAPDPRFYLLTEIDRDAALQGSPRRVKRNGAGPSLSIVNPLDVLRQALLLEYARRRMRQSEDRIQANRELLDKIGKRDVSRAQQRAAAITRFPDLYNWSTSSRWGDDYASSHQS